MIDVQRFDDIRVPAADMEAANRFYAEVPQGVGVGDRAVNHILVHHREAPYRDGSLP